MITAKTATQTLHFDSLDAACACSDYQDFVFLDIKKYTGTQVPPLPPRLQILQCMAFTVMTFPDLPESITNVTLDGCSIETIPDLSACVNLEMLQMVGNCLQNIKNPLPPNLRVLNVSYNQMYRLETRILPISLAELDVSYNFLKAKPDVHEDCHLEHRGNEYLWKPPVVFVPRQDTVETPKQKVVYENKQNVHASSVQNGINASVQAILEATLSGRWLMFVMPEDVWEDTCAFLEPQQPQQHTKKKWWHFRKNVPLPETLSHALRKDLKRWCNDTLIHSNFGLTFSEILARVVFVARCHPDADTLRDILRDELEQSLGQCFTGRFSRVVNVLVGFVEGVHVGIDPREQLQARMAALSKCTQQKKQQKKHILIHAMDILTEFGNDTEWRVWLDALLEYTTEDIIRILADTTRYPRRRWLVALFPEDDLYNVYTTCGYDLPCETWEDWLSNSHHVQTDLKKTDADENPDVHLDRDHLQRRRAHLHRAVR